MRRSKYIVFMYKSQVKGLSQNVYNNSLWQQIAILDYYILRTQRLTMRAYVTE